MGENCPLTVEKSKLNFIKLNLYMSLNSANEYVHSWEIDQGQTMSTSKTTIKRELCTFFKNNWKQLREVNKIFACK